MTPASPGEIELYSCFSQHLGPRFEAAGLRVQFHYNQTPGIHFRVPVSEQYRAAITRGIQEGLASRFPQFPVSGSVWITEVTEHKTGQGLWEWLVYSNPIVESVLGTLSLSSEERDVVIVENLERLIRERAGDGLAARLANPVNIGIGTK